MSEDILVRNSFPTLAGIMAGSLFSCPFLPLRQTKELISLLS